MRNFRNDYNFDGKEQRISARKRAGNRCIRCGHPYESGKGENGPKWTACDEKCTHGGPITVDGIELEKISGQASDYVSEGHSVEAKWRILTVHHFDGDKANDAWWNTLALCQRCHLQIQGKVDPEIPWFLEHSEWLKPCVAGFYARKYEGRMISKEEAESRIDELLAYEFSGNKN